MGFLHTSGAISLSQLQSHFGGSNPISMGEYYRNASYVPSIYTVTTTTTITTSQPASGSYFVAYNGTTGYEWRVVGLTPVTHIYWNGATITTSGSATATSYTSGGWTYYRSTYERTDYTLVRYRIYRQQTTTTTSTNTTNINTGIPTSGMISMSQFYGGQK